MIYMKDKEIELKFKIIDEKKIKEKLREIKFKPKEREEHVDIPLSQVYNQIIKSWARIRYFPLSEKVMITIKGKPKLNNELDTVRDEVEFTISEDIETVKNFFRLIGYMPMGIVKKSRESFVKEEVDISIDRVNGLGLFLEIEVKHKNEKEAIKKLNKYKKILNLKDRDVLKQGYFDLKNKNACALFYRIINNADKENFIVEVPENVNIKKISESVLEIVEEGSYFIGFLHPFKLKLNQNKLSIKVLKNERSLGNCI